MRNLVIGNSIREKRKPPLKAALNDSMAQSLNGSISRLPTNNLPAESAHDEDRCEPVAALQTHSSARPPQTLFPVPQPEHSQPPHSRERSVQSTESPSPRAYEYRESIPANDDLPHA